MDINSLKNIDIKKITDYLKRNYDKDAGLFTAVLLLIIGVGIYQFVMPNVSKLGSNFDNYNKKKEELRQFIEKDKTMSLTKKVDHKIKVPVKIYESPYPGMDLESASVELVEKIIKIIKNSGNSRINEVEFGTLEVSDNSGTNAPEYGILRLTLNIDGTYKSIKDALNEICLMKYLVSIRRVDISTANNGGYETITAAIVLDIYIKKA